MREERGGGFFQNCSVGKVEGVDQITILTTDSFGTLFIVADTGVDGRLHSTGEPGAMDRRAEGALALSAQT